jgi:hypothetical protein
MSGKQAAFSLKYRQKMRAREFHITVICHFALAWTNPRHRRNTG